jgi:hypothetical protein
LYESAKVNENHSKEGPAAPRDYQDRLGVIRNVEHRAGEGLFGELHFNPKHALAEQLAWDAEHNPSNVGFSHNVLARVSRDAGVAVVEEITRVQSVDLVADPAATRGLFEHAAPEQVGLEHDTPGAFSWNELTVESLRHRRADLCEALGAAATEALQQELNELREQHRRRLQEDRIAQLTAELSPLGEQPTGGVRERLGAEFVEMLVAVDDDDRLRRLVQERVDATAQGLLDDRPQSVEQNSAASSANRPAGAREFARAVSATSR